MDFKNILLIRTDRIGDVILTTPAINILRQNFPAAKISFLTRAYTAPLLKYYNGLDEIIEYRPESAHMGLGGHLKLSELLRGMEIDIAFLFHPKPGLAFSLFTTRVPYRVGTGYRWYSFLLNRRIYEHRKYGKRHELEYNLSLIEPFVGALPKPDHINFNFDKDHQLTALRQKTLNQHRIKNNYIIIHPGSGGSAPNLPAEKYAKIIQYLSEKQSNDIVLVGDQSERDLVNKIAQVSTKRVIPVLGEWNLETYMSVIAGAKFFISNSTGPLHIARAFDIPLLAFYCPAVPCSPERWGPYHRKQSVLTPDIKPCKSCNIARCPHGNCLDLISWKDIEQQLKRLVGRVSKES